MRCGLCRVIGLSDKVARVVSMVWRVLAGHARWAVDGVDGVRFGLG